jgi:hypothetical protein
MRNGSSCYPAFSLAAALALLIQGATLAATGSIAFEGREWTVDGSIKTSISSAGSFGQDGQSTIGFEAGGFALTDPEGDTLISTVATAKVKHGLSLGLTLNAKFNAEGDVEAERVSTTGGYTVKGTGVPE